MNRIVNNIMTLISNHGYDVYYVGGYVRDYLLGIKSDDYDLCTSASIEELKYILNDYEYDVNLETLCIKIDAIKIEITPYRKEVEYYNRRPIKYEHVNNLIDDLYRRDFTINSICMDKDGNIVDLLNGRNDLNNKIIRCIGNSNDRIVEDPLRILRALRFSAYLNFDIDNELMKSIYDIKELLRELSYERKYLEIDKIIDLKRLDILEGVSEYLDIDLSNIKYYNSKILVWMNIDYLNKYCISKKDRNIIDSVNKLNSEGLNNYSIYKYGLYISSLVGELNNIDVESASTNIC